MLEEIRRELFRYYYDAATISYLGARKITAKIMR